MLTLEVSVPQLGEVTTLGGGDALLGDEKSVMLTVGDQNGPVCAVQMPAARAITLSRDLWRAAREADGEVAGLLNILREAAGENA